MDSVYLNIGKHIKEYRLRNNLTQQQVAETIDVSENYYGKVERGKYMLSYNVLNNMYEKLGWDIDYIVTGQAPVENPFTTLLQRCPINYRPIMIRFIVLALISKTENTKDIKKCEKSCLKTLRNRLGVLSSYFFNNEAFEAEGYDERVAEDSILYSIKVNQSLSNEIMAKKLGLSIRSYESLERGKIKPGVETFVRINKEFGYNPSFIITGDFLKLTAVYEIWEHLTSKSQEDIMHFLENVLVFLQ